MSNADPDVRVRKRDLDEKRKYGRALLTLTQRAVFDGSKTVDDNYRLKERSVVRNRLRSELPTDLTILREHEPELYNLLCELLAVDGATPEAEILDTVSLSADAATAGKTVGAFQSVNGGAVDVETEHTEPGEYYLVRVPTDE